MRFGRIAAFCAASVFAGTLAATAFAQTPYDGNWQVTIVTKSGSCEPTASSMLTVADGKITAPGANVSGTIGSGGLVKVSINGAYAPLIETFTRPPLPMVPETLAPGAVILPSATVSMELAVGSQEPDLVTMVTCQLPS